ncbi:MAG: hypothetical protein OEW42_09795 [Acidimicrobiia bacterium]|nr:hypothetical protein [Acidimicrobiia bacterium]
MPGPRCARPILLVAALTLVAMACSGGGAAKAPVAVTPTTEALPPGSEPISLAVIVPDYTTLIPTGDVPHVTPVFAVDRWRAEAAALDDAGTDNPWSARFQTITWDPTAGTDAVCAAIGASSAALFVSAARLPTAVHDCLDADDRAALTLTPGRGERTFSVLPATGRFARAAAARALDLGIGDGPVVVVVGDDVTGEAAARGLTGALHDAGRETTTVTVPSTLGVEAVRRAVPTLLDSIRSASPGTVLYAANTTIAGELGDGLVTGPWRTVGIDVDGLTDHWASGRLPPAWLGTSAITALAPTTIAESRFEAECRASFEAFVAGTASRSPRADWVVSVGRGVASTRGAIDGSASPPPDIGYHECTLMRTLGSALATVEPPFTTGELVAALRTSGAQPVARARQGDFGTDTGLVHHTLVVELTRPDDLPCAAARQRCWTTSSGDRSGLVSFG